MEKSRIVEALGEEGLRLPALLNEALSANDRAKFLFTLLQVAREAAEHPGSALPVLRAERESAGLPAGDFEDAVAGATQPEDGVYAIPGCTRICERLQAELAAMLAPLQAAQAPEHTALEARLARLRESAWSMPGDRIDAAGIDAIVSGGSGDADTVHRLVMDLHKALNRLQAGIASESIEGAHAYGVQAGDRPLVAAFMRGIARTRALKFDHPGLGTTATRSGARLVIQNDIGTTDAHVLVVHVEGLATTLTYTDVHMQRLRFFQDLFDGHGVDWEDTRSRSDRSMDDGLYHLCVGRHRAEDREGLEAYLAFLGSRLVFLIDWNRARKRLRLLLPKRDVAALLRWAAEEDLGHMAFLRAGAEQMVFDALAFVARAPSSFGARLDDVLGKKAAPAFMRFVLRACARGLLGGRSEALVRDEIRAELLNHVRSAQEGLLEVAAEQAALALEVAAGIRDALPLAGSPDGARRIERNAARAREWEHRADALVASVREQVVRTARGQAFRDLIEAADDVVDELEEAAFHLALMPRDARGEPLFEALAPLAATAVECVQEYLKSLEAARTLHRGSPREDSQDFLEAVHRILSLERRGDEIHRSVKSLVPSLGADYGSLFGFIECARNLEAATDALLHAALQLRDGVLGEMAVQ